MKCETKHEIQDVLAFMMLLAVVYGAWIWGRMDSKPTDQPKRPPVICAECAGPVDAEPQRVPNTNRVYHVPMNEREYEFWLQFENSDEYVRRIYPKWVEGEF